MRMPNKLRICLHHYFIFGQSESHLISESIMLIQLGLTSYHIKEKMMKYRNVRYLHVYTQKIMVKYRDARKQEAA